MAPVTEISAIVARKFFLHYQLEQKKGGGMSPNSGSSIPVWNWIFVPALVTLAVTILRLVGELNQWSSLLFGRDAGGGFSLVGIVWLVPIFGIYFGAKLARQGHRPASMLKAALLPLAAFLLFMVAATVATALGLTMVPITITFTVVSGVLVYIAYIAWPDMGKIQFAYGLAARIPVAIVMIVAIYGNWGTHYDVPPPAPMVLPDVGPFMKWVLIGLLPQLTTWIAFTMMVGAIFGTIGVAIAGSKKREAQ
jgi:hypothetical protein